VSEPVVSTPTSAAAPAFFRRFLHPDVASATDATVTIAAPVLAHPKLVPISIILPIARLSRRRDRKIDLLSVLPKVL
jgi:hypothetical protein